MLFFDGESSAWRSTVISLVVGTTPDLRNLSPRRALTSIDFPELNSPCTITEVQSYQMADWVLGFCDGGSLSGGSQDRRMRSTLALVNIGDNPMQYSSPQQSSDISIVALQLLDT